MSLFLNPLPIIRYPSVTFTFNLEGYTLTNSFNRAHLGFLGFSRKNGLFHCSFCGDEDAALSQALLLPGDNIADFHREVRANGEDVFVRVKTIYKFPEGGPIYVGNAANGVQCEAGYDGDKMFDGKGIRCDRRETRKAVCDIGWTFDSNPGKDKCFIEKIVFGNKVRVDGQYTIPEGTTGALGNPEQLGWDLKQDHSGNRDYWAKEGKDYKFPKSL